MNQTNKAIHRRRYDKNGIGIKFRKGESLLGQHWLATLASEREKIHHEKITFLSIVSQPSPNAAISDEIDSIRFISPFPPPTKNPLMWYTVVIASQQLVHYQMLV